MSILSYFENEKKSSASFFSVSTAVSATTGYPTDAPSLLGTATGFLYDTRVAETLLSEKFRNSVDSVFLCAYSAISGLILKQSDTVTIDSVSYNVVHYDDIGRQNEVWKIELKAVDNVK